MKRSQALDGPLSEAELDRLADPVQAGEVIGLVMGHWNTVGHNLQQSLKRKDVHLPLLQEDADGVAQANDWAQGFLWAVSLSQRVWNEIILDDDRFGMILPFMTLAHEHDPDPSLRPDPISVAQRERLIELMTVGLIQMYRYFEPHRRANAIPVSGRAPRRSEPKVGRNEPCPCGSGKKFKRCCGGPPTPTLH